MYGDYHRIYWKGEAKMPNKNSGKNNKGKNYKSTYPSKNYTKEVVVDEKNEEIKPVVTNVKVTCSIHRLL